MAPVSVMQAADEEVAFAGAARLAEMLRAGEVSPSELVELYLERIASLDPKLNVYRVVLDDQARADAKRAEERLARPVVDMDAERARIALLKSLIRLQVATRVKIRS